MDALLRGAHPFCNIFQMKKISLLFTLFIIYLSAFGSNIDNFGRLKLAEFTNAPKSRADVVQKYYSTILEIEDDSDVDELASKGILVFYQRNNLLLACIPEDLVSSLNTLSSIRKCSFGKKLSLTLDKALSATKVNAVLSGNGLPGPYSGKGILVGFSDLGFDPGHSVFGGRVVGVSHFDDETAMLSKASNPNEIKAWTTDSEDITHATHVGGILAGNDESTVYRGVARGADIYGSTSQLYDVGILVGVEEIIAHAKAAGQPAVINLSLGSMMGPHDGTDLFCQYLDYCAEDAAILMAAGNDGTNTAHIAYDFSSAQSALSVMINSYNWSDVMLHSGYLDLWSTDNKSVYARLRVFDKVDNSIVWEGEWSDAKSDPTVFLDSDSNTELAKYFQGQFIQAREISEYNGRHNLTILLNLYSTTFYPNAGWSRYAPVIDFRSDEGAKVDVCLEGNLGFFEPTKAYPWVTGGDTDLTVSSMAAGFNTICVGSCTTRDHITLISGDEQSWLYMVQEGTTSSFTSYGTSLDGRHFPHFCAPGAFVVSAMNRYFLAAHPDQMADVVAESSSSPGNYFIANAGTSMATPHAAGIFALWLEAEPTLSGKDLREIAMRTASLDGVDASDPRTGAGVIDALAGLRHILGLSGLAEVPAELIEVYREGNSLVVRGVDLSSLTVEVYNLNGMLLYDGPYSSVSLPSAPVIVRLITPKTVITRKVG